MVKTKAEHELFLDAVSDIVKLSKKKTLSIGEKKTLANAKKYRDAYNRTS